MGEGAQRIALATVAGGVSLSAALAGFRLVPDTSVYAAGFYPRAPLAGLSGALAGLVGVVVVSVVAAALCVYLLPSLLFAIGTAYHFAFPGADALGLVFVLLALHVGSRGPVPFAGARRALWITFAGLAHPVAAITSAPFLWRRDALGVALCAVLTVAVIVGVGLYDGFTTTDRYALPLFAAALMLSRRRELELEDGRS